MSDLWDPNYLYDGLTIYQLAKNCSYRRCNKDGCAVDVGPVVLYSCDEHRPHATIKNILSALERQRLKDKKDEDDYKVRVEAERLRLENVNYDDPITMFDSKPRSDIVWRNVLAEFLEYLIAPGMFGEKRYGICLYLDCKQTGIFCDVKIGKIVLFVCACETHIKSIIKEEVAASFQTLREEAEKMYYNDPIIAYDCNYDVTMMGTWRRILNADDNDVTEKGKYGAPKYGVCLFSDCQQVGKFYTYMSGYVCACEEHKTKV